MLFPCQHFASSQVLNGRYGKKYDQINGLGKDGHVVREQADRILTEQVKDALGQDRDLKSYALKADVAGGRVRIEGVVDTLQEKQRVESLLRNIPGVTTVANAVSISTDGSITTRDVAMEVQEELQLNQDVNPGHIGVESVGGQGTVILRGHTNNPAELEAALQSASTARGVTRVLNQVKVGPKELTLDDIFHSQVNNDRD